MFSVKFPGQDHATDLPRSMTVLEAALVAGYDLGHTCGGKGRCATCEIKVVSGPVGDPTPKDYELLFDRVDNGSGQRLGCQCRILGEVVIDVPVYTTSIDGIYDSMPGYDVKPEKYRSYQRHKEIEEDRDLKSPFYLFRKKYGVTQGQKNRRSERHRFQQGSGGGNQQAGGGRRRPRLRQDFEDLPDEVEAQIRAGKPVPPMQQNREVRPDGSGRRDHDRRRRRHRGRRHGGGSQGEQRPGQNTSANQQNPNPPKPKES